MKMELNSESLKTNKVQKVSDLGGLINMDGKTVEVSLPGMNPVTGRNLEETCEIALEMFKKMKNQ